MWPRKLIDVSWNDLSFAFLQCVTGSNRPVADFPLPDNEPVMRCLSVRTGFDLYLQAVRLPPGSEVMMSAVTIPDMVAIVRRHGFVPVPLDLDIDTLSPSMPEFARKITPRTRAIVLAHLFGARMDMDPILAMAKPRLLVIEDCAQAYAGSEYLGHPECDVSLFSFGPVKTATALGGALIRVRDQDVLAKMLRIESEYPLQQPGTYARRLAKYALLKIAAQRVLFDAISRGGRVMHADMDAYINSLARNFGKRDLLISIRQRPCRALSALLARRWMTYGRGRLTRRSQLGAQLAAALPKSVVVPGRRSQQHGYWLFPIVTGHADELIGQLQQHGFDATRRHNLALVSDSASGSLEATLQAARMLRNVVFLPMYPELTDGAVRQMADLVCAVEKCCWSRPVEEQRPQCSAARPPSPIAAVRCKQPPR